MHPKAHLIERLKELCKANGGADAVAMAIDASPDNLRQILAGTQLPSGQPRGVGPLLQRKLEARFPGWATANVVAIPASANSSPKAAALAAELDKLTDPRLHAAAFLAALDAITSATAQPRKQSNSSQ